jgi:hypothetical protein
MEGQTAILVLGMHRSGTSALTGVLSLCGVYPSPQLLPSITDVNPKGFWEHAEVVSVHDELLAALGSCWDDERTLPQDWHSRPAMQPFAQRLIEIIQRDFHNHALWLIKDPRMCRLLPIWLDILEKLDISPSFVLCLRHPGEVALSLLRRDEMPEARASLIWLEHVLQSERMTRGRPRVFVTYDQLMNDWKTTVDHIFRGLRLPKAVDKCDGEAINRFLEPSLRHHTTELGEFTQSTVGNLASQVYEFFEAGEFDKASFAEKETRAIAASVSGWAGQIQDMKKYIQRRNAEYQCLEAEIARMKHTFSWRMTRPFRAVAKIVDTFFSNHSSLK